MSNNPALEVVEDLLKREGITATWRTSLDGEGCAHVEDRHVEIPTPTTPSRIAVALHEIGHVLLDKATLPVWRNETRASRWALTIWRGEGWPDYDMACYALGSRLNDYLEETLRCGDVTPEEIEKHIPEFEPDDLAGGGPNGLLPYAQRLGLRGRVDPELDRLASWETYRGRPAW